MQLFFLFAEAQNVVTKRLNSMNEAQARVVAANDSHLLVVAGPGTGKTFTIVQRIARLIGEGARPGQILAVTFTNRAAREMRERTEAMLGATASKILMGTFHLLGLRLIREQQDDDFVILGRDEQVELLKSLMHESSRKAAEAAEKISRIKNLLDEPDDEIKALFLAYQGALREKKAFDFDDLITVPLSLLEKDDSLFRDRFKHIIVDEYQDINPAQYRLLRALAGPRAEVCAVGDSDQAIYAFRGADIENFLNFEKDFSPAARITLSENYRSTDSILEAASQVIGHNKKRIAKELVATRAPGAKINVVDLPDERAEAAAIISEIEARIGGVSHLQMAQRGSFENAARDGCRFSDFAVVFRTNSQVRALEEAFAASGLPFQVIGKAAGARKKEREETLAYLRSLAWPEGAPEAVTSVEDAKESRLLSAADYYDPRADCVTLMTMHMAKGLEFPVVFVAGCDDGLVPCSLMKEGVAVDREEERRLFYVAMTRAKDELFLLRARTRFLYGQRLAPAPSPFLAEIPEALKSCRVIADKIGKQKPEEKQMGLF